jgi:hypothetical protein
MNYASIAVQEDQFTRTAIIANRTFVCGQERGNRLIVRVRNRDFENRDDSLDEITALARIVELRTPTRL